MARQQRKRTERPNDAPQTPTDVHSNRSDTHLHVGDRVRAKTTIRTGKVTHVAQEGDHQHVTVSYDHEPQDDFLTTPAHESAELPRELVDHLDEDGAVIRAT